jgi:hypothetical protein
MMSLTVMMSEGREQKWREETTAKELIETEFF